MNSGRLFFDPSCHDDMFLGNGDPFFRGGGSVMKMEEMPKKRPFLTSFDELFDDEYYDEQFQEKKRRLTSDQVQMLEKCFEEENKLEPERKNQLAKKLGLQPRQVAVWFQNRRARWKTKQLERDYDQLKISYESLLCNYKTVAKENDKLRTEMVLLTEKLQTNEVTGAPESTQEPDPLAVKDLLALSPQLEMKVEDHLSSGSGGSAVVDEDAAQLVDCGDSYFPEDNNYPDSVVPLNGVQSEEDDGSKNGGSYFTTTVFEMAAQQNYVAGEPMGWWVWS